MKSSSASRGPGSFGDPAAAPALAANHPRIGSVRGRLRARKLDAMVVLDRTNTRFLTGGFRCSYSVLVIDRAGAVLITDARYAEAARRDLGGMIEVLIQPRTDVEAFFADLLGGRGYQRVGIEGSISVDQSAQLGRWIGGAEQVVENRVVADLRIVKDAGELAEIRRATRLADRMMAAAIAMVAPGVTEADISRTIRRSCEDFGGEGESFANIVASGPNSALPHHHPGRRRLAAGDPVTIDLGGIVGGYCSDLTRTVVLGKPDPDFAEIYRVCLEANLAAIAAARPGMTGVELDGVARTVIDRAGYGEYFGHGLGHGVGLEIHEEPRLSPRAGKYRLAPGNVITIEPGIYIPGRFGVRIEDYAVVTADGIEVLSKAPKKLRSIKT